MMRARSSAALCVAIVMCSGPSAATGTIIVGPVGLSVDNGKTESCVEAVSGLCLARIEGESMGDTEFDGDQTVNSVELWVDRTQINDMIGFDLLPDGAVRFVPSMHEVPFPVPLLLAEHVGTFRPSVLEGNWGLNFREDGMGAWYFGPDHDPIDPMPRSDGFWLPYDTGDDEADATLDGDNDSMNLGEDLGNVSNDDLAEVVESDAVCAFPGCAALIRPITGALRDTTPNIIVGAELSQAMASLENDSQAIASDGKVQRGDHPLARRATLEPQALFQRQNVPIGEPLTPARDAQGPPLPSPPSEVNAQPYLTTRAPWGDPRNVPPSPPIIPLTAAFALAVLAAALYSRLKREDLIQAPHRARILAALEERGPLRLAALARLVGVDRTTVCYHAELLERAGLVRTLHAGRSTYLGLPGQELPASSRAGGELGVAVQELLALHRGGLPRSQLHEMLPGVPQRTRNHALQQLLAAGAVLETPTETGTLLILARKRNARRCTILDRAQRARSGHAGGSALLNACASSSRAPPARAPCR